MIKCKELNIDKNVIEKEVGYGKVVSTNSDDVNRVYGELFSGVE